VYPQKTDVDWPPGGQEVLAEGTSSLVANEKRNGGGIGWGKNPKREHERRATMLSRMTSNVAKLIRKKEGLSKGIQGDAVIELKKSISR